MRHVVLGVMLLASACASSPGADGEEDDDAVAGGKGDAARVAEGSAQAAGILRVANELAREALGDEVGLDARAADGIVAARPFATLAALDAVPHVGPVTFDKLLAAAEARGWVGPPPCVVASGGSFALDVPVVRLTGQLTVGRRVPPRGEGGAISLQTAAGDRVSLGDADGGVYAVTVLPGTYEIVYEHGWGESVPQNRRARLGSVTVTGSRRLDIDVPVVEVTPAVTVDGVAPPPTSAELRLRRGDDEASLGQLWEEARPVRIVPGTYDVEYALEDARDEPAAVPRNRRTVVRRGVELARDARLEVALATAPVAARVDEGRVVLDGVLLDDAPATLLAGDYDVEHWLTSTVHAVVDRVRVAGPTTLDVAARAFTLTARVTVNGGAAPLEDAGVLLLARGDERIWLGRSSSRSFSTRLLAGRGPYDVVWSHAAAGGTGTIAVPRNQEAVLARGVDVEARGELVVELPAVPVSGRVSGAAPGDAVWLVDVAQPASRVPIAPAADGSFTTLALPGRYRAAFRPGGPDVTAAPFGEVIPVAAPATRVELAVPAREVAAAVRLGAAAAPGAGWTLSYVSPGEVVVSTGGDPRAARRLVPGRYDLLYAVTQEGSGLPANQRALIGCVEVPEAPE